MVNKAIGKMQKKFNTKIGINMGNKDGFSSFSNMYIELLEGREELCCIPGYRKLIKLQELPKVISVYGGESLVISLKGGVYLLDIEKGGAMKKITELAPGERLISLGSFYLISNGNELYSLSLDGEKKLIASDKAPAGCKSGAVNRHRMVLSQNPDMAGDIFFSAKYSSNGHSFEKISSKPDLPEKGSAENAISSEQDCAENAISSEEGSAENAISSEEAYTENIISFDGYIWLFKNASNGGSVLCYSDNGENLELAGEITTSEILSSPIIRQGEILIATSEGIMAISLSNVTDKVSISYRFLAVDYPLPLIENQSVTLGIWREYLALAYDENILLLRKRKECYDCFPLKNIVGYLGDERVYRYSEKAEKGYETHKNSHSVAKGVIMSKMVENGRLVYYSDEGDKSYLVYPTEEMQGGKRLLPERFIFTKKRMMFFTKDGSLYIFNNDKKTAEESAEKYYSFAGHRIECEAEGELMDLSSLGGSRERAECKVNMEMQAEKALKTKLSFFSGNKKVKEDVLKFTEADSKLGDSRAFSVKTRLPCQKAARFTVKTGVFGSPFILKALSAEARKT